MNKLTLILVLLQLFFIWMTKRSITAISEWHQINAHSGGEKEALPATIWLGPYWWGTLMFWCAMALVVHITMTHYAEQSYDTFGKMVPIYPGAKPVVIGSGVSPSLDRKLVVCEYTESDSKASVVSYYTDTNLPYGWQFDRVDHIGCLWLKNDAGHRVILTISENKSTRGEVQRHLKYALFLTANEK